MNIILFFFVIFLLVLDDIFFLYWDKISWLIDYNRIVVYIVLMLLMYEDSRSELWECLKECNILFNKEIWIRY